MSNYTEEQARCMTPCFDCKGFEKKLRCADCTAFRKEPKAKASGKAAPRPIEPKKFKISPGNKYTKEDFANLARLSGYENEIEMWETVYVDSLETSMYEAGAQLGVAQRTVMNRLLALGYEIRPKSAYQTTKTKLKVRNSI